MPQESQVIGWRGRKMVDRDGSRIGVIEDVFIDDREEGTAWALVKTGRLGRTKRLIPIGEAQQVKKDVEVPFPASLVANAPDTGSDGLLSIQDERTLVAHYAGGTADPAKPVPSEDPPGGDEAAADAPERPPNVAGDDVGTDATGSSRDTSTRADAPANATGLPADVRDDDAPSGTEPRADDPTDPRGSVTPAADPTDLHASGDAGTPDADPDPSGDAGTPDADPDPSGDAGTPDADPSSSDRPTERPPVQDLLRGAFGASAVGHDATDEDPAGLGDAAGREDTADAGLTTEGPAGTTDAVGTSDATDEDPATAADGAGAPDGAGTTAFAAPGSGSPEGLVEPDDDGLDEEFAATSLPAPGPGAPSPAAVEPPPSVPGPDVASVGQDAVDDGPEPPAARDDEADPDESLARGLGFPDPLPPRSSDPGVESPGSGGPGGPGGPAGPSETSDGVPGASDDAAASPPLTPSAVEDAGGAATAPATPSDAPPAIAGIDAQDGPDEGLPSGSGTPDGAPPAAVEPPPAISGLDAPDEAQGAPVDPPTVILDIDANEEADETPVPTAEAPEPATAGRRVEPGPTDREDAPPPVPPPSETPRAGGPRTTVEKTIGAAGLGLRALRGAVRSRRGR